MPLLCPNSASNSPLARTVWIDRAVTVPHLALAHDLDTDEVDALLANPTAHGLHLVTHDVGLTRNARPVLTTFACRDARTARYAPHTLRQLAGTAAMRERLSAPWSAWTVRAHHGGRYDADARTFRRVPTPDARWLDGDEDVWVEYDAGSHTRGVLAEKLATYAVPPRRGEAPRRQIWGASTEARAATIFGVAARVLERAAFERMRVMVVDWRPTLPSQAGLGLRLRKGQST
ncbi:hypothetical protein [Deinococcus yavapaiensis]|uniref:Uncharacterized protein n=1 Tax=Deinococcus yavapaiensis KR-236 TaxID=694435 RepID=A0A318S7H0_9DEIO|nr:hypothetical protein [Deinococcus yavapaiensis]PYE52989.1 hypothetical protein DES52_111162 [Deinococcus yavapaiensis KR-236]